MYREPPQGNNAQPMEHYGPPLGANGMPMYQPGYAMYHPHMVPMFPPQGMWEPEVKSLVGPITDEAKEEFARRRSFMMPQNGSLDRKHSKKSLSRKSSIYSNLSRKNSLSHDVINRDTAYQSFIMDMDKREGLKDFYGDMAGRVERQEVNGMSVIASSRNAEGRDMAKPRRAAPRKGAGYGSVTNHRESVMNAGGQWGDIRSRSLLAMQGPPMMTMGMPEMFEEQAEPVFVLNRAESFVSHGGDVFVSTERKEDKKK